MTDFRACDDNELQIDLYKAICKAYTRDAKHLPDVLDEVSLRNVVLCITEGSDAIDKYVARVTARLRERCAAYVQNECPWNKDNDEDRMGRHHFELAEGIRALPLPTTSTQHGWPTEVEALDKALSAPALQGFKTKEGVTS